MMEEEDTVAGQYKKEITRLITICKRKSLLGHEYKEELEECNELIQSLELLSPKECQTYKAQVSELRKEKTTKTTKTSVINTGESRENSLQTLKDARDKLLETEEVGKDTLSHLASQEETIKSATRKIKDTNSNLDTSNKYLTKMSRWWRG